jgi:hypothetical protein
LQKSISDVTSGDDTAAGATRAGCVAVGAEGGTSNRGYSGHITIVVEVRTVQCNLVLKVTARDDSALPGAVALEVKEDAAWRSGFGLDGLFPVRRAWNECDESSKVK